MYKRQSSHWKKLDNEEKYYRDINCSSQTITLRLVWKELTIGDEITYEDGNNGYQYTVKVDSYNRTMHESEGVGSYNSTNYCGFSDWELNVEKNYTVKKPLVIYHTTNSELNSPNINIQLNFLLGENSYFKVIDIFNDLSEKAKAKRVAKIKHLSAKGSANCPNSLVQLNLLAR